METDRWIDDNNNNNNNNKNNNITVLIIFYLNNLFSAISLNICKIKGLKNA